jgi:hypothetical protein
MGPDKKNMNIFSEAAITILITLHIFYGDHNPKLYHQEKNGTFATGPASKRFQPVR